MPTITAQAPRSTIEAQTSGSHMAPMKSIVANTRAGMTQNPYTTDPLDAQPVETPDENGVLATNVEEAPKDSLTLSPQLTALARREQKFRQQEQAFKAERAKFEAEKSDLASLKPLKDKIAAKDYSTLEELGVDPNEYADYWLNKGETEKPEHQAIRKLEEKLTAFEENQKKSEEKLYEQTLTQYRNDIRSLVASDPEFEGIKESGAEEHVLQHIIDTFEQDNETLTVAQAAKEVEEEIVKEAMKLSKLKKLQAKEPQPQSRVLPPPQRQSGLRTLTQQIAPAQPRTFSQSQHLSPRERLAQAVAKANRKE